MGCISGCMVKSNLVIYLVPYLLHYRHLNTGHLYNDFDWIDLIWKKCPVSREHPHKHSVHHETSTRLTLIFNTQTSSSFGIDKNYFRDMLKLGYSITLNFVEDLNLLKPQSQLSFVLALFWLTFDIPRGLELLCASSFTTQI